MGIFPGNRSIKQAIRLPFRYARPSDDTCSAMGNPSFNIMCVLAEHESNMIRETTKAGQ